MEIQPWADPEEGGTGGTTCPLQTVGRQKWSDRVGFVSLAGQIPKCTKTCMKSHKIAYVMTAPNPARGAYDAPQTPQLAGEGVKPRPDIPLMPSASRFVVFGDLVRDVPLPKQFSGSAPKSSKLWTAAGDRLAVWLRGNVTTCWSQSTSYSTPSPVNTWMGDCLLAGTPSRYVTSHSG